MSSDDESFCRELLSVHVNDEIYTDKKFKKIMKFLHKYKGKHADMIIDDNICVGDEVIEVINEAHDRYIQTNKEKSINAKLGIN